MEKLFVQIFERKNRIIEQVKQQTELYNQNLVSKLLIEGITPPYWLWNPTGSSDSKELNKEELISNLLGPHTLASVACSTAQYSLYDKPSITGANQEFSDGFLVEALNNCPNEQGSPTVSETRGADAGCSLNCVPELDFSITSLKDQTTAGFLNIHNAPDQSLARIQRSKSRQKALEFRNSANTVAESALDHENIDDILPYRIISSISSSKQKGNEYELPEFEEPCAFGSSCYEDLDLDETARQNKDNGMDFYNGRITRSRSHIKILGSGRTSLKLRHSQNDKKDVSFHGANTGKRSSVCASSRESQEMADSRNRLLQSTGSSSAFGQNNGDIRLDRAGSLSKEKGVVCSGKLSSFKSSHRPQSCASDSWKADGSSNDTQRMVDTIVDFGDDLHKDHIDGSPVKKNIFDVGHVYRDSRGSILEGGKSYKESINISEPVYCSEIPSCSDTLSKSPPRKKSDANDKVQNFSGFPTRPPLRETKNMLDELGNVDFIMDNELVAHNLINHSVNSSVNGGEQIRVSLSSNGAKQRRQLESLVAQDSIDCFVSDETKQLDFSVTDEQNSKTFSSSFGKKRPDNSPKNVSDHELLLNKEIPNSSYHPSLGGQSPEDSEILKNVAKVRTNSSECDIQEHFGTCAEKYVSLISETTTPKRSRDNIEGGNHQHSEVEDKADIMMSKMDTRLQFHPVKQCLEQGHETSAEQVIEEGNWRGEGSAKSSEVSHATGSKEVGQPCFPKLDNPGEESHDFAIGKTEMSNPMHVALDKVEQFPAQESQILSGLTGESQHADTPAEDNRVVTIYRSTKRGEDVLLEGGFGLVSSELGPQLKRRKIEELQVNTSHPSSVKHVGSIQRDSPSKYLRNIEMDVNTDLTDSLDRTMSTDIEMDQDKDSPGEESHDFSIGKAEMENPMHVDLDKIEQFLAQESQILSGLTGESRHADTPAEDNRLATNYKSTKRGEDVLLEGRFGLVSSELGPQLRRRKIEELQMNTYYPSSVKHVGSIQRESPGRSLRNLEMDINTDLTDSLDRKMSTDVEMDQDKDTDYINSENLTRTTRTLQAEKSPPLVDGQQSQCFVFSPKSNDLEFVAESMPVFEGFNVDAQADSGDLDFTADGVDLAKLSLSRIAIQHASIIEEMCRSASLDTPMSHLSSALNFQGTVNPFQSLPNGLLEHLDLNSSLPLNVNVNKQLDSGNSLVNDTGGALERIERMPYSPYSGARDGWNARLQHASPVGRLWERLSSHSGSSEVCSISNPELTCFPIEEDPCISEDSKWVDEIVDDVEEETDSLLAHNCNNVWHPLKDLSNMGLNPSVSTFAQRDILSADTVDDMSAKSNVGGTQDDVQWSPKNHSRYYSEMRENQRSPLGNAKRKSYRTLPIGYAGTKKAKGSIDERVSKPRLSSKTSLKRREQNVSLKDSRRNNIVSNISSFIPLVQQKQAAAVCAGKRDIKVKALEAAEAAKRLEEKRMIERKNRKEALKLERAKLEVENLRKMEIEKKKKELERKKKDADAISNKRLREEEARNEKEKKRMRLEARRDQEERGRAEKAEKEKEKRHTKDEQINIKKSCNEFKNEQNRGVVRGEGVASKKAVIKECGTSGESFEAEKALNMNLIVQERPEKSYEISPYQCSEDEDGEDELPTKKFIPSWARKSSLALVLPLQDEIDPDLIFHHESCCSTDEGAFCLDWMGISG